MYYMIEMDDLRCDPEAVPVGGQQSLTAALSAALGPSQIVKPLRSRPFCRRLRRVQMAVIAARSRFSQLPPECLFVVINGCVADSKRGLKSQERMQLAKITEIAITRYEAP